MAKIKYEHLLLIFAILFTFFFLYVLQLKIQLSPLGDDLSYFLAAKKIYYSGQPSEYRPLFIAIIDGFPLLFRCSDKVIIYWGIFINYMCWLGTILLLFKIVVTQINRKTAFFVSLFFISCIGNLAITFNYLSESIFIFMLVLLIVLISNFYKFNNYKYITLAIALLLLAMLVKPMSIGLVFIISLFFVKQCKKIVFNSYFLFVIVSLLLIFFQMNSLKKQYGDYTISYVDSITYYNYLGAKAVSLKDHEVYLPGNKRGAYFLKFSSHQQRKIANKDILNQMKNNKLNLFKAYLFCIYSNSSKGSYIVNACKNEKETVYFDGFRFLFKAISKIQNIVITILGVFLSLFFLIKRKNQEKIYTITSLFMLYIFFISAISCYQCDRFHIVFYPLVILLAAKFLFDRTKLFFVPLQK